ncbi:D-aminoacyl-tRNA deacylase [Elongatibacter sediminis]|uniref:D-aminoacyl-tRNA deacylase n=1 Tax=Elongatibacter sediminis TaxID=3119006 RepID=A0AAW9R988_9GAMM
MIALVQRVAEAAVHVNGEVVGRAGRGTLALIGVERGDGAAQVDRLLQRLLAWRMFPDDSGRMNLNLAQAGGDLLLVPQFTLAADTDSGNRPSFTPAAPPDEGRHWFGEFVSAARQAHPRVECGVFGADMQVQLVNDGPVTFWLQVRAES